MLREIHRYMYLALKLVHGKGVKNNDRQTDNAWILIQITSSEIKTKTADFILKMTIILNQLCSKNGQTLPNS